jgi:hypothetical protein
VIEDPYVRYRDVEYRWIALTDWTYSRRFPVSADLLAHSEVLDHRPWPACKREVILREVEKWW